LDILGDMRVDIHSAQYALSGALWPFVWAAERNRRRALRVASARAMMMRTAAPDRRRGPAFVVSELHPHAVDAVALTLDDGPDPRWTEQILDVLAANGVPATFYLVGANVRSYPGLARRIVAQGHTIGNHTMSHPQPFARLSPAELRQEIVGAQRVIGDATGVLPRLFRAPAGGWSPTVLEIVAEQGMAGTDWIVDPKDWRCPGTGRLTRRILRSRAGEIVLCHDAGGDRSQTVAALRAALPEMRERGVRFVAL
jgi:peptidoglycan-N-acetylglucosamine deacetylase